MYFITAATHQLSFGRALKFWLPLRFHTSCRWQSKDEHKFCRLKHRFILAKFNAVKHNRLTSISSYWKVVLGFE